MRGGCIEIKAVVSIDLRELEVGEESMGCEQGGTGKESIEQLASGARIRLGSSLREGNDALRGQGRGEVRRWEVGLGVKRSRG